MPGRTVGVGDRDGVGSTSAWKAGRPSPTSLLVARGAGAPSASPPGEQAAARTSRPARESGTAGALRGRPGARERECGGGVTGLLHVELGGGRKTKPPGSPNLGAHLVRQDFLKVAPDRVGPQVRAFAVTALRCP